MNRDLRNCIPANPDISGIGVRAAIYTQSLLCFLPVVFYLWDGKVTVDELAGLQDQSIGMLAIAFAILLTTVTLAAGSHPSVSNYHAYIVLSLSWLNNTSTWIWFILHVYAQSTATYKPIDATWKAWMGLFWTSLTDLPSTDANLKKRGNHGGNGERVEEGKDAGGKGKDGPFKRAFASLEHIWFSTQMRYPRFIYRCLFGAPVLSLGSIHLSLMAAIGIWLWSNPSSFGKRLDGCTPILTIFGASSSFSSRALRIFSLTMYSILLIPGLNLLPPFAFFLFLHISYTHVRRASTPRIIRQQKRRVADREHGVAQNDGKSAVETRKKLWSKTAFLLVGLVSLFLVNILFIVDTEFTLHRNEPYQGSEEREWGFGQILAMLLLVVPLRDAWIALRNIQNNLQQRFDQAFDTICEADEARDELGGFLRAGVNPRRKIPSRFGYALHKAAYYGKLELIKLLVPNSNRDTHLVDVDAVGGDYGTALQAASARGHMAVVAYLVECGVDPNITGGDYGTALCAACAGAHLDTVTILLAVKNIKKNRGSQFGLPIHIATMRGKKEIVEALVENQPQEADGECMLCSSRPAH
ncbi:hypothetical protein C8J57DRAFT_102581 [Mycena rebaudengoi]|nr:hypothetical protein C8J57DRAFT_102581 [Mycena rebaudengoi]